MSGIGSQGATLEGLSLKPSPGGRDHLGMGNPDPPSVKPSCSPHTIAHARTPVKPPIKEVTMIGKIARQARQIRDAGGDDPKGLDFQGDAVGHTDLVEYYGVPSPTTLYKIVASAANLAWLVVDGESEEVDDKLVAQKLADLAALLDESGIKWTSGRN